MKRILAICVAASLLFSAAPCLAAQEEEIRGTFIIPPQYLIGAAFFEGRACVSVNSKSGFIDEKGALVIPMEYDFAADFHNGLSVVEKNGLYGAIDRDGNEVIPIEYESMDTAFEKGDPIYVKKDGKYGFIDETGKTILPFVYSNVNMIGFNEGICAVQEDGPYGFIDEAGMVLIPYTICFAGHFKEKVAQVHNGEKWGLMTRDGQVPLGYQFDEIGWSMNEGVIAVSQNGKWALSDGTSMLTQYVYEGLDICIEGRMSALRDGKSGYLDSTGKEVIPFVYDGTGRFSEGLAAVGKDGKYGFIDASGNEVLPFVYEEAGQFEGGTCAVKKDGAWGLIDKNGQTLIPFLYDWLLNGNTPLLAAEYQGETGYIYNPASGVPKPEPVPANERVEELKPDSWARQEISQAYQNGLVEDSLMERFQEDITREEFCRLIVRMIERTKQDSIYSILEEKKCTIRPGTFSDTDQEPVLAANALGIVFGKENGKFMPGDPISREEAAVMLTRLLKAMDFPVNWGEQESFADTVQFSSWAADSISIITTVTDAVGAIRVMQGDEEHRFLPQGSLSRQQAIVVMWRMCLSVIQGAPHQSS